LATSTFTCFAIAAPGLESTVARELATLGEEARIEDGGVSWEGDRRSVMRANLWLRTASRVLVRVARFNATAFYELEKLAKKIPWDDFLSAGQNAEFRVTARKSKLYHSDAIAERLLRGVTSGVGAKKRASPNPRPHTSDRGVRSQLFVVRALHDEFTISADTSGELLHMRGYRQAVGKAPLRETLAAALLLASGWRGEAPLIDPFCGSGTISIEGALLARRIAPGLQRRFAFMDWPDFNARLWEKLATEARANALASSPVPVIGSDRDAGAIDAARANAKRAGVEADIDFAVRAVSAISPPHGLGLVATNPPYGMRVSRGAEIRNLYARLGQVIRERCAGWQVAMYSPDPRLSIQTGLEFTEMLRTTNGGIKVAALYAKVPGSPA
jgi:putative N6-adenine-specific DNA methylase